MGASMRSRLPYLLLIPLLAVSFGFHAHYAANPTTSYQSADERSYGRLAVRLVDEHRYGVTSSALHWPPGAPVLFGVAYALFGDDASAETADIPAAYWLQALLALGTTLAAFGLAWALAGPWAGLIAAALVGLYPPLILATGEQLSEPLGAFLLTAGLCVLALAAKWRLTPAYAAAGALLGLCVLTRADLIALPFLTAGLCALWLYRRRRDMPRAALVGGLLAGGALLVIAPWSYYASGRAGELVPVTTGGSSALFVGTYLPGNGNTVGMKRALAAEAKRQSPKLRGIPAFEIPAREILAVVAARHPDLESGDAIALEGRRNLSRYGLSEPFAFARMMANKGIVRMWSRYARGGARHTSAVIRGWHILLVIGAFGGVLAGLYARRNVVLAVVLTAALCSTAIHMLVVSQARYNLPLMPALLAAGVGGWFLFVRQRRRSGPALGDETAIEQAGAQAVATR